MAPHFETVPPELTSLGLRTDPSPTTRRPRASWTDDLLVALFGAWAALGAAVDSWAHFHQQERSIFTPWHAPLYSGTFLIVAWTLGVVWRRRDPGAGWRGLPLGYDLGLIGFALYLVGATADLAWHAVFGLETNLDVLLSPTHLLLFLASILLLAIPLRSAWGKSGIAPDHRGFLPMLVALLDIAILLALITSWGGAWFNLASTLPVHQPALPDTIDGYITVDGVASVLVTNLVMLGPVLVALRRWRPPRGTVTLLFTVFALAQVAVHTFAADRMVLVVAAALGGFTADAIIASPRLNRRRRSLLVATITPVVMWSGWSLVLAVEHGTTWTLTLSAGTVALAALSGLGLHVLVFQPAASGARPAANAGAVRNAPGTEAGHTGI